MLFSRYTTLKMELKNDVMIRACKKESVPHTPIWLMRQAGRYLPEYREVRGKHSFIDCCYTPDLAATLTLQPLERFSVDAVVFFSDILVILKAMGYNFKIEGEAGIVFEKSLKVEDTFNDIAYKNVLEELEPIYKGIDETIKRLEGRVPLIGFAGAPWTLMCYIVEKTEGNKHKQKFEDAMMWCYKHKKEAHHLLNVLAQHISDHLVEQANRGAGILQIFDSWAGFLTPELYKEFGLPYIKKVVDNVKSRCPDVPIICFAKGAYDSLEELSKMNVDCLSIDQYTSLDTARKVVEGRVALQGNLDPLVIKCDKDVIVEQVKKMLKSVGDPNCGYIANLGHGCVPDFDPEHVKLFIDTVHDLTRKE